MFMNAYCKRGHSVRTLDDLNPFYEPVLKKENLSRIQQSKGRFTFIQGDLLDQGGMGSEVHLLEAGQFS
jgi:nucleoside-diphosphate-sugar epimerase